MVKPEISNLQIALISKKTATSYAKESLATNLKANLQSKDLFNVLKGLRLKSASFLERHKISQETVTDFLV